MTRILTAFFENSLLILMMPSPTRCPRSTIPRGAGLILRQSISSCTIPNDGIYRITQTQLDSIYPAIAGADPRTFQIFDRGKEIPIFVSGESDGVFNPGDYLEFPALRNYTGKHRIITTALSQEYNEYLDRYTDSTILWLTWGTKNGMRLTQNPVSATTTDTLRTYTAFLHMEIQGSYPGLQMSATDVYSSQDYRWNPFDLWPWDFLNGSRYGNAKFYCEQCCFKYGQCFALCKDCKLGCQCQRYGLLIILRFV